jgi:opacity protein-like surface antigen
MLDTALTVAQWRQYSIYGIAGIGAAWNHISYRDRDNSNAPCSLFNVGVNKSKAHFVWEAGAGAVYAFNDTARLSLEYLYTDFGRLSASSNGSSINFNLHAQAVLLGLHLAAG